MKITSGLWAYLINNEHFTVYSTKTHNSVAHVLIDEDAPEGAGISEQEAENNAILMSLAPLMLSALQEVDKRMEERGLRGEMDEDDEPSCVAVAEVLNLIKHLSEKAQSKYKTT